MKKSGEKSKNGTLEARRNTGLEIPRDYKNVKGRSFRNIEVIECSGEGEKVD